MRTRPAATRTSRPASHSLPSNLSRRLAVVTAFVMLSSVIGVGVAFAEGSPTQPPANCAGNTGYACAYSDNNYLGNKYLFGGQNESWAAWAIFNNDDSVYNNGTTGRGFRVYKEEGWAGSLYCIPRGWGWTISWWKDNNGESNTWPWNC